MDEYVIDKLVRQGARIDAFGVGTRMSTSVDRPYVDVVYKLAGRVQNEHFMPTMKLSDGKLTLPGKKQIYRFMDDKGKYAKDIIGLDDENIEGDRVLKKVMDHGEITYELPPLQQIRETALTNLSQLPEDYKKLKDSALHPVVLSSKLQAIRNSMESHLRIGEGRAPD